MAPVAIALPKRRARTPDTPSDPRDVHMRLLDYLDEFRKRLVRAAIAVGLGMLIAFFFIDRIVHFIFEPSRRMLPPGAVLVYTQPGEAFSLYINVALISGAILASPFVFYQLWALIAPALYIQQKKLVIPFILLTTVGSLGGAAFSHYVVFPYMIAFFGTFSSPSLTFLPKVEDVFGLYLKMLIGMVVVFQMPTLAYFLARMGVVSARWLWQHLRYAILVIFIVAAVLTPSADPWNQTVVAAPMIVLYILSIVIAWMVAPRGSPATDR